MAQSVLEFHENSAECIWRKDNFLFHSLENKDLSLIIISLCGTYREGKSSIFNLILQYLRKVTGKSSSSSNSKEFLCNEDVTPGIYVWPEEFIVNNMNIILINVQELDRNKNIEITDVDRERQNIVLAVSSFLSSIQIKFYNERLNYQELDTINNFFKYGKNWLRKYCGLNYMFQNLLCVIQNWNSTENPGILGGESYFNTVINPNQSWKQCFRNANCHLMSIKDYFFDRGSRSMERLLNYLFSADSIIKGDVHENLKFLNNIIHNIHPLQSGGALETYSFDKQHDSGFEEKNTDIPSSSSSSVEHNMTIDTFDHDPLDQYKKEFYRLLSLPVNIPFDKRRELAEDGFYNFMVTPPTIQIKCAYCDLQLDSNCVIFNSVPELHALCSSDCPLVRGDTDIYNIKLFDINEQNLHLETHRIITFLAANWPKESDATLGYTIGALELAKNGFAYIGPKDTTHCAFCHLKVCGWEEGDTALGEHLRWNPECPFLKGLPVGNIPLSEEYNTSNGLCNDTSEFVNIAGYTPKHESYKTKEARIETFGKWAMNIQPRPTTLASAGFYYTGVGDRVICYFCGGGLKDWAPGDSPDVEHAKWFPKCHYILALKGHDFVNGVQQDKLKKSQNEEKALQKQQNELTSDGRESSASDEPMTRLCKVCMDRELGIVFLPCGHMSSCVECAPQLDACPVCRGNLSAYIRAFLP